MIDKINELGEQLDKIVFDKKFVRVYIKSPYAFSDSRYVMDYASNLEAVLERAIELKKKLS